MSGCQNSESIRAYRRSFSLCQGRCCHTVTDGEQCEDYGAAARVGKLVSTEPRSSLQGKQQTNRLVRTASVRQREGSIGRARSELRFRRSKARPKAASPSLP